MSIPSGSRHTLERVVRACATTSRAERELVRALREQGVGVRRGWSEEDGERERAVGEWSSSGGAQRSVLARRAEREQRGLLWHRCTMEIERVRQGLRAAGSDPVACVHAAREGAGMLARRGQSTWRASGRALWPAPVGSWRWGCSPVT